MSPILQLREGILGGDWQKVCDGFANLTGERLRAPAASEDSEARVALLAIRRMADSVLEENASADEPERSVIVLPDDDAPQRREKEVAPDFVLKTDIDGPGPEERIVEKSTGEKNCYDVPIKLVSQAQNTITAEEVQRNRQRADRAAERKEHRAPIKMFEIVCTGCGRTFASFRPALKGLGQKCPGCMKAAREARGD